MEEGKNMDEKLQEEYQNTTAKHKKLQGLNVKKKKKRGNISHFSSGSTAKDGQK